MKLSQLFMLFAAIYIAPNLTPKMRTGVATACLVAGVVFSVLKY